jgi:hypothetical protein
VPTPKTALSSLFKKRGRRLILEDTPKVSAARRCARHRYRIAMSTTNGRDCSILLPNPQLGLRLFQYQIGLLSISFMVALATAFLSISSIGFDGINERH